MESRAGGSSPATGRGDVRKTRSLAAFFFVAASGVTGVVFGVLLFGGPGASGEPATVAAGVAGAPGYPSDQDRAVALGLLLDTPRTPEVTDQALIVSEKLRQQYGIDSGNPLSDREEAARRAQVEFLDRLVFEEDEVRAMAAGLGYSLDPAECANYCENVRELATVELKRQALQAFADGESWPGRLAEESELVERELELMQPVLMPDED